MSIRLTCTGFEKEVYHCTAAYAPGMLDSDMVIRPTDSEEQRQSKRDYWAAKTRTERVIACWEYVDELDRQRDASAASTADSVG